MSELEDRRQRALDAALDGVDSFNARGDWTRGIEVATQVRLTDDVVDRYGGNRFDPDGTMRRKVMREVLEACGFEVIE